MRHIQHIQKFYHFKAISEISSLWKEGWTLAKGQTHQSSTMVPLNGSWRCHKLFVRFSTKSYSQGQMNVSLLIQVYLYVCAIFVREKRSGLNVMLSMWNLLRFQFIFQYVLRIYSTSIQYIYIPYIYLHFSTCIVSKINRFFDCFGFIFLYESNLSPPHVHKKKGNLLYSHGKFSKK